MWRLKIFDYDIRCMYILKDKIAEQPNSMTYSMTL